MLTTEQMIESLNDRGYIVRRSENRYDPTDRVRREALMRAGPIEIGAYRVRDPQTDEWSSLQFHMTFGDVIIAVASEEAAKLFCRYVTDTLSRAENKGQD